MKMGKPDDISSVYNNSIAANQICKRIKHFYNFENDIRLIFFCSPAVAQGWAVIPEDHVAQIAAVQGL